ncbi:hypothetical protein CCACVL1_12637 [Corchorus capsularis]|uniref:Apple domain-containing protein n=1 Tax=Corchorus capsularis TaxID=210143 RepID=A0A1R3IEN7_COCAP|nr:hypothetical protein CCACVL1_12637 [Corchorus capsularis]
MLISLKLIVLLRSLACLWICCAVAAARNTLNQGEKLNSSNQLVSENGSVTLRFIKLEYDRTWDDKDFGFYLAIQYTDFINQSIDDLGHPICTSRMKLGFSRERNWSLSSWLSESIPAPGPFNLKWDPFQERLVISLRDRVVWTSGEKFANIPFLVLLDFYSTNYSFTKVFNGDDEQYAYYTSRDGRKYGRVVMKYDGGVRAGEVLLDSYNCGGDSTKGGCERWDGPKCRSNGDKYELKTVPPTSQHSTTHSTSNKSLTVYDCKDMCWKDCQCMGVYAGDDNKYGPGCHFLIGPYVEGIFHGHLYQIITTRHHSSKF